MKFELTYTTIPTCEKRHSFPFLQQETLLSTTRTAVHTPIMLMTSWMPKGCHIEMRTVQPSVCTKWTNQWPMSWAKHIFVSTVSSFNRPRNLCQSQRATHYSQKDGGPNAFSYPGNPGVRTLHKAESEVQQRAPILFPMPAERPPMCPSFENPSAPWTQWREANEQFQQGAR